MWIFIFILFSISRKKFLHLLLIICEYWFMVHFRWNIYVRRISFKWGSLFLRHIGSFGLVQFTLLLEVEFIVSFMFHYHVCFLNIYKNIKTKKHPYWVRLEIYLVVAQFLSVVKTRYLELSVLGEAYMISPNNTFQLQTLNAQWLHKPKVSSVDAVNVHCLQQNLSNFIIKTNTISSAVL